MKKNSKLYTRTQTKARRRHKYFHPIEFSLSFVCFTSGAPSIDVTKFRSVGAVDDQIRASMSAATRSVPRAFKGKVNGQRLPPLGLLNESATLAINGESISASLPEHSNLVHDDERTLVHDDGMTRVRHPQEFYCRSMLLDDLESPRVIYRK